MSSSQGQSLLCVAPYVPWAGIDHAGGSYLYQYLREFVDLGWKVQLAAPSDSPNSQAAEVLSSSDPSIEVRLFSVPQQSKLAARIALLLEGRDGVSPGRWSDASVLAGMARAADIVDLQWHDIYGYAGWYAASAPDTRLVALAHDLRSQSVGRNAAAATGIKRVLLRIALLSVRARERKELGRCDRLYAFKGADLAAARRLGVRTPGRVAPPYVDLDDGEVVPDIFSRTVVFPAAFFRSENVEAAHWFLDEVWPLVVARVPDASVRFAGARPPADLLARASERVTFTGYLPSILDGYRGAVLTVAPLRRGAGLKFKVVQAMALGFPVVGTSVAMEGIEDLVETADPRAFDEAPEFADRVVEILECPQTAVDEASALAPGLRARVEFSRGMAEMSLDFKTLTKRPRRGGGSR